MRMENSYKNKLLSLVGGQCYNRFTWLSYWASASTAVALIGLYLGVINKKPCGPLHSFVIAFA
jgi:hypothetical protein